MSIKDQMKCLAKLLLVLSSLNVWGAGYRNPPAGAAAFGRHGGNLTLTKDASSLVHNPAQLTEVEGGQAYLSTTFIDSEGTFKGVDGSSAVSGGDIKMLPSVFIALPLNESNTTFGMGIHSPYGNSKEIDATGPLRYLFPYETSLRVIEVDIGLGYQPLPKLRLGFALNVYKADFALKQRISWANQTGVASLDDGLADIDSSGVAVGTTIGATYALTDHQSIALRFKSSVDIDFKGDATIENVPDMVKPLVSEMSQFGTEIPLPTLVTIGYGIALSDNFRVGADVEWVDTSKYDELPVDLGKNNRAMLYPSSIPQKWTDAYNYYVGGEYDVSKSFMIRGGYAFLESPVPSSTMSPSLVDLDKHWFTLGCALLLDRHLFETSFAFALDDERSIRNNLISAYNGSYDSESRMITISYGYTF